jgi:hypothetical protein
MEEVCDLRRDQANYAWCFDCLPEENYLLLRFGEIASSQGTGKTCSTSSGSSMRSRLTEEIRLTEGFRAKERVASQNGATCSFLRNCGGPEFVDEIPIARSM